jgi:hypothetical protein
MRALVQRSVAEVGHHLVKVLGPTRRPGTWTATRSRVLRPNPRLSEWTRPHKGLSHDLDEGPLRTGTGTQQYSGKSDPARSFGIHRSIDPTRVSARRVRYPLRRLSRSGNTSPYGAPHSASASAPISPSAKLRTISRNGSLSPAASCLRSQAKASLLSLLTAISSRSLTHLPVRPTRSSPYSRAFPAAHHERGRDSREPTLDTKRLRYALSGSVGVRVCNFLIGWTRLASSYLAVHTIDNGNCPTHHLAPAGRRSSSRP